MTFWVKSCLELVEAGIFLMFEHSENFFSKLKNFLLFEISLLKSLSKLPRHLFGQSHVFHWEKKYKKKFPPFH